jgi:deoxycytidylate deaminase
MIGLGKSGINMRFLSGRENEEALYYLKEAEKVAKESMCLRSKCGSVITKGGQIIGRGYNSPPKNQKTARCTKGDLPEDFKSDKTCCVHAEQRAVMNALRGNPDKLPGSRLYFIRLDMNDNILKAGKPYCTICSKMALDAGVSEFVLWHEEGIAVYDTDEYNRLSFAYSE